ncbi:MAG: prepilin-type N-terminal cleavage/methylation domain-containing protein [Candidatus Competibacterales bacterium]
MPRSRRRLAPPRQRGFTLMEVLVAFAILGVTLGTLLQVFATGLRNTALATEYTRATLHAQSLLAGVGITEPLEAGVVADDLDDTYRYEILVEPVVLEGLDPDDLRGELLRVAVAVRWGEGGRERQVVLEPLRLTANLEDS